MRSTNCDLESGHRADTAVCSCSPYSLLVQYSIIPDMRCPKAFRSRWPATGGICPKTLGRHSTVQYSTVRKMESTAAIITKGNPLCSLHLQPSNYRYSPLQVKLRRHRVRVLHSRVLLFRLGPLALNPHPHSKEGGWRSRAAACNSCTCLLPCMAPVLSSGVGLAQIELFSKFRSGPTNVLRSVTI